MKNVRKIYVSPEGLCWSREIVPGKGQMGAGGGSGKRFHTGPALVFRDVREVPWASGKGWDWRGLSPYGIGGTGIDPGISGRKERV